MCLRFFGCCSQGQRSPPTVRALSEMGPTCWTFIIKLCLHLSSAALNVNYRGTLQLDISPFTLYLKQHAATSKSRRCLWCCKKKELQWSTKNQCNFLVPCFIHLLSPKVWDSSPKVQTHLQGLNCAFCQIKWRSSYSKASRDIKLLWKLFFYHYRLFFIGVKKFKGISISFSGWRVLYFKWPEVCVVSWSRRQAWRRAINFLLELHSNLQNTFYYIEAHVF